MAQLGRQVLLIDADLRKPRMHRVFNLPTARGWCTALPAASRWNS